MWIKHSEKNQLLNLKDCCEIFAIKEEKHDKYHYKAKIEFRWENYRFTMQFDNDDGMFNFLEQIIYDISPKIIDPKQKPIKI